MIKVVDMFPLTRSAKKTPWICSHKRTGTKKGDMTFILSPRAMLKQPRKHPISEKVEAIKVALKHFETI